MEKCVYILKCESGVLEKQQPPEIENNTDCKPDFFISWICVYELCYYIVEKQSQQKKYDIYRTFNAHSVEDDTAHKNNCILVSGRTEPIQ